MQAVPNGVLVFAPLSRMHRVSIRYEPQTNERGPLSTPTEPQAAARHTQWNLGYGTIPVPGLSAVVRRWRRVVLASWAACWNHHPAVWLTLHAACCPHVQHEGDTFMKLEGLCA